MDKVTMSVQEMAMQMGIKSEQSIRTDQRGGFPNRPCRQAGIGSCFRI